MADIKIGIHYSRLHNTVPLPEFARMVEDMGFDSVWVPEGLVNEVPALDIMMAMSAFVHHTKNMTVGTSVLLLPLRNPAILAKQMATLDLQSGGRTVLGIGAGGSHDSNPIAFEVCNVSLKERGARCDEYLDIMTKLWTGTSVSHNGRFLQFKDMTMEPRPVQQPHPPIWTGGYTEGMLKRTARICDGFVPVGVSAREYAKLWDKIQAYGEGYGRDVSGLTKALHLFSGFGDSRQEARKVGEATVNERRGFEVTLQDDDRYAFGTLEDCMETMESFIKVGVTHFIFNPLRPIENVMGQVERLGKEVVPHFK